MKRSRGSQAVVERWLGSVSRGTMVTQLPRSPSARKWAGLASSSPGATQRGYVFVFIDSYTKHYTARGEAHE